MITPADLAAGATVRTIEDGDLVKDNVSLDLCNADFPSEDRRRARHQVTAVVGGAETGVMTEALLYDGDAGTAQAFAELRAARQECPDGFVPSEVEGVPPLRTTFGAPPDTTWPQVPGIERLAFTETQASQDGTTDSQVVVYQRRGRLLVVIYLDEPNGTGVLNPEIGGLQGVAEHIAERMSAVPTAVVERATT